MNRQQDQLKRYKVAYSQLEHSFKNNLNVIKELQQQNQQLQNHIQQVAIKYEHQLERALIQKEEAHKREIQQQDMQFARELDLVKKEYEDLIATMNERAEQKNQELVFTLTKKHRAEMQGLKTTLFKQFQTKQFQLKKANSRCKSLQQSIVATESKLNASNMKVLSLQAQIQRILIQKKEAQTLYSSYQQQLQTLKNSSNSWEDILKSRIKELEHQKSSFQQEMAEMKFLHKEKIKKFSQQSNKKITQLEESHSLKLNQTLMQSKEISFKFQAITQQNIELKNSAESCRKEMLEAKRLLDEQKIKFLSVQDSVLTIKEKDFEIKSINQDLKRLKSQLKMTIEQKDKVKEQFQRVNQQRQSAQKAVERLKVQLLNKTKQLDNMRKQLQTIRYKTQLNTYHQQTVAEGNTTLKSLGKNIERNQKISKQLNLKDIEQYSRCFTEDMGPVDENFFIMNSANPPIQRHKIQAYDQIHEEKQASIEEDLKQQHDNTVQLMKRIAELQIENNQYKITVKTLKDDMERTSLLIEDKIAFKERQNRLSKDQNLLLREKLHDKEEQLMTLKETIKELKQTISKSKESQKKSAQATFIKQQNLNLLKEKNQLQQRIKQLQQEAQDLIQERKTLEDIADDLRAELNYYKQEMNHNLSQGNQIQKSSMFRDGKSFNRSLQRYQSQYPGSLQNQYRRQESKNYSQDSNNLLIQQLNPAYHPNQKNSIKQNQNISNRKFANEKFSSNVERDIESGSKSRSKSPKQSQKLFQKQKPMKRKLHELIKQKNQLESQNAFILGKKATIQKRFDEQRPEHVGTKSQKDVYDRLQRISRSRSKQRTNSKLKDYQIKKPEQQIPTVIKTKLILNEYQQKLEQQVVNSSISRQNIQGSNQEEEKMSQMQMTKRIAMINKIREEMANDQFDHLENVSLSYWDQQV